MIQVPAVMAMAMANLSAGYTSMGSGSSCSGDSENPSYLPARILVADTDVDLNSSGGEGGGSTSEVPGYRYLFSNYLLVNDHPSSRPR